MKRIFFRILVSIILIGIAANAVLADEVFERRTFIVKDGESIVRITRDFTNYEVYHLSAQNVNWEWYTSDEFEYEIMIAREPSKKVDWFGHADCLVDFLRDSIELRAERDKKILQQTLADIKKGIKVSKPIHVYITRDGLQPWGSLNATNLVGWAHWYVYGYTFTDKAGKEVDLGIYETRTGLFNALKFYCDKEVRAGRMTKREADRMYRGLAHNVRNCDEVALGDKLVNFRNLYNPYLFMPIK